MVNQQFPEFGARTQSVSLRARTVQRRDQLRPELFPKRVVSNQPFELAHHFTMRPAFEVGIETLFERRQISRLQPHPLGIDKGHYLQAGQRRPPPKPESGGEQATAGARLPIGRRGPGPGHQVLETADIDGVGRHGQLVATALSAHRLALRTKGATQSVHQRLETPQWVGCLTFGPQVAQKPVGRDHVARRQCQTSHECQLQRPSYLDRLSLRLDCDGAEQADLDHVASSGRGY